jgi:2-octaprenyl-6-methoxyphenol hydroxylase
MKELECDILIVGAGLTGLMTAYTLASLKKNIILIDKFDFDKEKQNKIDIRTTAISEGSKDFFNKIKIWEPLSKFAEPIKKIHVVDRSEDRKIIFHNDKFKKNLGYIVKNSAIKNLVLSRLKKIKNIKLMKNFLLKKIHHTDNFVSATFEDLSISASLLIAADGKKSSISNLLKTKRTAKKYDHSALVLNIFHKKNHFNTAHEIFFNSGPLAILPMKKIDKSLFSSSVVWSSQDPHLPSKITNNKKIMTELLQEKIFKYVGEISNIIGIEKFPLSAHINNKFYEKRIIYIGDSAHSIHPIAGQGWNLGVKDIENCFLVLKEASKLGLDIGESYFNKRYNDKSYFDAFSLFQITDKLNSIFIKDGLAANLLRKKAFKIIEKNKLLKKFITNYAMGY